MKEVIQNAVKGRLQNLEQEIEKRLDGETVQAIIVAQCDITIAKVLGHRFHGFFADMAGEIAKYLQIEGDFTAKLDAAVTAWVKQKLPEYIDSYSLHDACKEALEKAMTTDFPVIYAEAKKKVDVAGELTKAMQERAKVFLEGTISDVIRSELGLVFQEVKSMRQEMNQLRNDLSALQQNVLQMQDRIARH